MADDLLDRLELAISASREAGQITLEFFNRNNFKVERKADDSPVTIADRRAEQHLRELIHRDFPHDGILGEEFGEQAGTSGFRWILDPIDGTKSFIHGVPLYGTLIGVEHHRQSAIGVIRVPVLGECVYAAQGHGAWHLLGDAPPRRARVGDCERLEQALFCTSEVEGFRMVDRWEVFERLQAGANLVRTWGDCYGYLLVATGRADVMVDPRMHVWDAAALQPILQEAGGAFTDWQGEPTIYGSNGVATNTRMLAEIIGITSKEALSRPS